MTVHVRLATRADAAALAAVTDAMDVHYRGDAARRATGNAITMVERTFDTSEGTRFLLAELDGAPVGMACFAVIRPGHALRGLIFLKDLFVVAAARGRGTGTALMAALARYALDHDIGRIDLETATDNTGAQALYERLGGSRSVKLQYRYDGAALEQLARAGK
jgi:GNAT superfamily N-acetyltransferase